MGASLLLIGGFGYPFAILTNLPAAQGTLWGAIGFVACSWVVHCGVLATLQFVYRVFRADAPLVRAAMWGAAALLLLTALAQARVALLRLPREEMMAANVLPATGLLGMAVLAYAWSAIESLRYFGLMRRRAKLGSSVCRKEPCGEQNAGVDCCPEGSVLGPESSSGAAMARIQLFAN